MFNTGSSDIILLQYKQAYADYDLHQKLEKIVVRMILLFFFFFLLSK